jgi:Tol biopolymer transport system component
LTEAELTDLTLRSGHGGTQPVWSPDGTRIAFWENTVAGLATMYADGSDYFRAGVAGFPVAWSPDGGSLLVRSTAPYYLDLDVYNLHRGTLKRLRQGVSAATYSSDGASVLFTAGSALQVMPAGGGVERTLITDLWFSTRTIAWSPDGSQIALEGRDQTGRWAVYVVSAAGGVPREIGCCWNPRWAP